MPNRVFTGYNVLVDGELCRAAVIVDITTGKIVDIRSGVHERQDFPDIDDNDWIDAGERYILPGLVE